ncbi:hypothetical protein JCM11251_001921 [Rhodosporidiobolus azoricus]
MATAFRPQPTPAAHGSRTMTATSTPTPEAGSSSGGGEEGPSGEREGVVGVLKLRGRGPMGQRVQWTEETVDNETLGRKKSKICCIYHKPKAFDESSDESSGSSGDDAGDSDSSAGSLDSRSSAAARRRSRRSVRRHHHHHHDGPCEHGEGGEGESGAVRKNGGSSTVLEQPKEKPEPNAYERSGGGGGKGKAVFAGGVLAYQLQVREKFLPGWKDGLDKEYDGPNEQIVFSLASSLSRQLPSATYVLAESGVAGPGLSPSYRSEIDSPGYCPLAIVGKGLGEQGVRKTLRVPQDEFEEGKERAGNMVKFSEAALEMVLDVLEKK